MGQSIPCARTNQNIAQLAGEGVFLILWEIQSWISSWFSGKSVRDVHQSKQNQGFWCIQATHEQQQQKHFFKKNQVFFFFFLRLSTLECI